MVTWLYTCIPFLAVNIMIMWSDCVNAHMTTYLYWLGCPSCGVQWPRDQLSLTSGEEPGLHSKGKQIYNVFWCCQHFSMLFLFNCYVKPSSLYTLNSSHFTCSRMRGTRVVNHLLENSGNFSWNVNGKRLLGSSNWKTPEIYRSSKKVVLFSQLEHFEWISLFHYFTSSSLFTPIPGNQRF